MTTINAVNITSAPLFGVDFEWTQELLMIAAMGIYFFSFALIAKANSDIRMESCCAMLPRSWQRGLGMLARLAVLVSRPSCCGWRSIRWGSSACSAHRC